MFISLPRDLHLERAMVWFGRLSGREEDSKAAAGGGGVMEVDRSTVMCGK